MVSLRTTPQGNSSCHLTEPATPEFLDRFCALSRGGMQRYAGAGVSRGRGNNGKLVFEAESD